MPLCLCTEPALAWLCCGVSEAWCKGPRRCATSLLDTAYLDSHNRL